VFVEMMLRLGKRVLREEAAQEIESQAAEDAAAAAAVAESSLT
jgi:hypothetical protein